MSGRWSGIGRTLAIACAFGTYYWHIILYRHSMTSVSMLYGGAALSPLHLCARGDVHGVLFARVVVVVVVVAAVSCPLRMDDRPFTQLLLHAMLHFMMGWHGACRHRDGGVAVLPSAACRPWPRCAMRDTRLSAGGFLVR